AREVRIPHIGLAPAMASVIVGSEAAAFHRRWMASRPRDYDPAVRDRIAAGQDIPAADYVQALRLRRLLAEEMAAALAEVDVLAMPAVPIPAPRFGQNEVQLEDGRANPLALLTRNTSPVNMTGFPAVSVPCGLTPRGLPVSLQLVGLPWRETQLLAVARRYELRALPQSRWPGGS
ncbi:MAG: amidase family protein, partial [Chloroflexota bacterium]